MTLHISPTEPAELKALGQVTGLPEHKGCDVMWSAHNKLFGIQRKTCSDLVNSVYNGKLNHEFEKMSGLSVGVLLIEGRWNWTRDGIWTGGWGGSQKWNRAQMLSYLASVQARGFWLVQTDELADTVRAIDALVGWSRKEKHSALDTMPVVPKVNRDEWVLQMKCPGIGPEMTKRLIEANGGELPLKLTMSEEEIRKVPGWGPKRAKMLVEAFRLDGVASPASIET